MQPFLLIASAHFLALLSPGPDFFLIARLSLAAGWRVATGACLGIALANAAFIVAAFAGTAALRLDSVAFTALQAAGAAYLLYLGILFIRHAGATALGDMPAAGATTTTGRTLPPPMRVSASCAAATDQASALRAAAPAPARALASCVAATTAANARRRGAAAGWWRAAGMGFLSGILNPKNALFYASLAAMLPAAYASLGWKTFYGLWMFGVVLLWDLLVAGLLGIRAVLRRFARALPWLERLSGGVLVLMALGIAAALLLRA